MRMKCGLIVIGGPAKDFTGLQMKGGTIVLRSGAEIRTGAWMNRGTIVSLKPLQMMPTFELKDDLDPTCLGECADKVKEYGIDLPHSAGNGKYQHYAGDMAVSDKGEILVWQPA